MKDLMITYKNGSETVTEKFDTIMSFLDAFEAGKYKTHTSEVIADFFENPLLQKKFNSVDDLYIHCKNIVM